MEIIRNDRIYGLSLLYTLLHRDLYPSRTRVPATTGTRTEAPGDEHGRRQLPAHYQTPGGTAQGQQEPVRVQKIHSITQRGIWIHTVNTHKYVFPDFLAKDNFAYLSLEICLGSLENAA